MKKCLIGCLMFMFYGVIGLVHAETYMLKAVTAWPKPTTDNQAFFIFMEIVKKKIEAKYPGQLEIKYLGGPEVIKITEQVQGLQSGLIDLCFTTSAYYVSLLPEIDAVKLSSFSPWEERERGVWEYLNKLHEEKIGVRYLARLGLGIKFHLYTKKPIEKADLRGLNIRVSPMYLQMVKALGGNPVVIPPTEVYTALERGVVDGYGWPEVGIMDWGWQKLTKYIIEPGFYQVPNPLLISLKAWNKLPEHLKVLLNESAVEAEKEAVRHFQELAKAERPKLLQAGLQVIQLPPDEAKKFLQISYDAAWKEIIEKCPETGLPLKKLLSK